MKILIIESCEKKINQDYSNTSIVHVRNSLIIADILQADIITHESQIEQFSEIKYDFIIAMYASPYMKWKRYFNILEKNKNAKLFWLVNDHDLEDNILLRQAIIKQNKTYDMICNNPRESYRHWILGKNIADKKLNDFIVKWNTINLNALIFTPEKREMDKTGLFSFDKSQCVYYGTFRKYRTADMMDYNTADYVISTSKKNQIKYQKAGVNARFMGRLGWCKNNEDLFKFKYSLYFEDLHTHTNYAHMANRYYECLMCDVLMFFDYRCKETIRKSGYFIPDYLIVKNGEDVNLKIKELNSNKNKYKELIKLQKSNFKKIQEERLTAESQLRKIFQ